MKNSTLPIRFGLVTAAALVAYFLILSLFNKHTNIFYSLFNGVITGFGIYETIKYLKLKEGRSFDYGKGFKFGLTTGVVATLLFTFFFMVYSTELNPLFLEQLSAAWAKDYSNFTAIVFFTVAIMGMATSLVLTLTFMQLFKTTKNIWSKA